MHKKSLCIFLILIMAIANINIAYAIDISETSIDIELQSDGIVRISANEDFIYNNQEIEKTLTLIVAGESIGALDGDNKIGEMLGQQFNKNNLIKYIGQVEFDESGYLNTEVYVISQPCELVFGFYDALGNVCTITKTYNPDPCAMFNKIKSNNDVNGMLSFLDVYSEEINFDFDAYNALAKAQKTEVMTELMASQDASSVNDLISISTNLDLFAKMIQYADDSQAILAYIDEKSKVMNNQFNTDRIKLFLEYMPIERQLSVIDNYIGKSEFNYDVFCDDVLMTYLNNIADYTELSSLLDVYPGAASFDTNVLNDYNNIDNKIVVKQNLYRVLPVTDISTFISKFSECVDEQKQAESIQSTPVTKPSTGGNRGGGGGGGYTIASKPVQNESDNSEISESESSNIVKTENNSKFQDLTGYEWATESINSLVYNKIIDGKDESIFAPGDFVTREEFSKMLAKGMRMTGVEASVSFVDVSESDWFYSSVAALYRAGIVMGINDTEFGVGSYITREDMAVMLSRAASVRQLTLEDKDEVKFKDEKAMSSYAKESVNKLAKAGIVNGNEQGEFLPRNNLNRAEAAKVIYMFLKAINYIS